MKPIDREATAREALAEVNLLDVASVLRSNLVFQGSNGLFFGVASRISLRVSHLEYLLRRTEA